MRKRRYLLAALAAVGLVAAACSSDGDGGATTEATAGVTAGDTTAATEPAAPSRPTPSTSSRART